MDLHSGPGLGHPGEDLQHFMKHPLIIETHRCLQGLLLLLDAVSMSGASGLLADSINL